MHSEDTDTDHDRIARQATTGADLVLFVITNELFSPRLADHLRYLVEEDGLALHKKTCVVVNKMDREVNPDHVVLGEVTKVLGLHSEIPVLFCAAKKYLRGRGLPDEERARHVGQSRFPELLASLDRFVEDAGALGRITMPLHEATEVLEQLAVSTATTQSDKDLLELLRRRRGVLHKLQRRLVDIRKEKKQEVYSKVMQQANDSVEQLGDTSRGEDVEALFVAGLNAAAAGVDLVYDELEVALRAAVDGADQELSEIGESPLARRSADFQAQRAARRSIDLEQVAPEGIGLGTKIAQKTMSPIKEGLKAAAENPKAMRDVVYKAGKTLGKKFRPFEAVKGGKAVAKWAGRAGKAMPYLAAALDFYVEYQEEKAKDEKARYRALLRNTLRSAFVDQARTESETLEKVVQELAGSLVADALGALDTEEEEVRVQAGKQNTLASAVVSLRQRCTRLRTAIHSAAGTDQATA